MKDDFSAERGKTEFWENLGFDYETAYTASRCFPEAWTEEPDSSRFSINHCYMRNLSPYKAQQYLNELRSSGLTDEDFAYRWIYRMSEHHYGYTTDFRHPLFWYAQGYDFDEMASRAVAANAMLNLLKEANRPQQQPDHMPDVLLALLATQQKQLPPPNPDDYLEVDAPCDEPLPQVHDLDIHEPFDPNKFPRLHI